MNEQDQARVQQNVRALYRYTNAMEHGKTDTIIAILHEAREDATLERMVLEMNEVYQVEDGAVAQADEIVQAHALLREVFAVPADQASQPAASQDELEETSAQPARPISLVAPMRLQTLPRRPARKWRQSRVAALVAALLLALLIVPALSAFAPQLLTLFQPQQFTAVNTNAFRDPLQVANSLENVLRDIGDNTTQNYVNSQPGNPTLSQSAAQQEVHFQLQLPGVLPAGTGKVTQFTPTPSDQEEFTFDRAKARAYLQQSGQTGVSLPAQLDGDTFKVSLDTGMVIAYYQQCVQQSGKTQCSGGTPFIVTEVPDPSLQAVDSASLNTLLNFLLSLPKLSDQVHTLLQHVDIKSGVVPVPLPQGASAMQTSVHGSFALLVTLSNGGGIIWQTQNIVYIILTAHASNVQIQASANSMR